MRVSWILNPGYFDVPTEMGLRQSLKQWNINMHIQPPGLKSGEGVGHRKHP